MRIAFSSCEKLPSGGSHLRRVGHLPLPGRRVKPVSGSEPREKERGPQAQKEDAGLSARIPPPRRFGWGDSNRRDQQLGAYIIQ
jgi:hypothetical protein